MKLAQQVVLIVIFLLILSGCQDPSGSFASYQIVPKPVTIIQQKGSPFALTPNTPIYFENANPEIKQLAIQLQENITEATGFCNMIQAFSQETPEKGIVLSTDKLVINDEGYEIDIRSNAIYIRARKLKGLYYAMQSLCKMMPIDTKGGNILFPLGEITDFPRFPYRGMHLDVARHFFSVEQVKRYIDILALHNVNYFHWHLTNDKSWRVEVNAYPQLTSGYSKDQKQFYTQDEIREIVAYAADRFIQVVPEINLPGHSLCEMEGYPQEECLHGAISTVCEVSIFAQDFMKTVMTEMLELFPSEYVHLGGEEDFSNGFGECATCQQDIMNDEIHQTTFMKEMHLFLDKYDKQVISWDNTFVDKSCDNSIVMVSQQLGATTILEEGYPIILTPMDYFAFNTYQDCHKRSPVRPRKQLISLAQVYHYEPPYEEVSKKDRSMIMGCQANLCTKHISAFEHVEYMLLPRLAALSEVQWSQAQNKDYNDFKVRMQSLYSIYNKERYNYSR